MPGNSIRPASVRKGSAKLREIAKAIEKWDKEILDYTNRINQLLNNDNRLVFKESQIAWENYYKKEQKFQNRKS